MRPGRFDRQVTVDAPDIKGRLSILEVHARNKKLQEDLKSICLLTICLEINLVEFTWTFKSICGYFCANRAKTRGIK